MPGTYIQNPQGSRADADRNIVKRRFKLPLERQLRMKNESRAKVKAAEFHRMLQKAGISK